MASRQPRERHPFGRAVWAIFSAAFTMAVAALLNNLAVGVVLWAIAGAVAVALLEGAYWADYKWFSAAPQAVVATHTPAQPAAPSQEPPAERIFVDRTPEELLANFKDVTNIQGTERVARYVGKWLRVSGPLGNVLGSYPGSVQVTFRGRSLFQYNNVYAYFRDKKWSDRLTLLSPGDPVTLLGRIRELDPQNVYLDDCELEP